MRRRPDSFFINLFEQFQEAGTISHHARKNGTSPDTMRMKFKRLGLINAEELEQLEIERYAIAKQSRTKQGHEARRKQIQWERGKCTGLHCVRCGILFEYGGKVGDKCEECAR